MDEHCFVICGDWRCCRGGNCNFVIDKQMMARVVFVKKGMKLSDIGVAVAVEFGFSGISGETILSYWPAQGRETVVGNKTPHVLLSSDGSIGYL